MSFNPNLTDWKVGLYEKANDHLIGWLESIALEKQMVKILNGPTQFAFKVPSDDPLVNLPYTDSLDFGPYPYLHVGDRFIRAWRYESGSWVLRFAGRPVILSTEVDEGEDIAYTHVTCFDAWWFMAYKMVRNILTGDYLSELHFNDTVANLIQDWVFAAGEFGVDPWTGIDYISGEFSAATTFITSHNQQTVSDATTDMTSTGACDIRVDPMDTSMGGAAGILGVLNVVDRVGEDKPGVQFGYDIGNAAAAAWKRDQDMTQMANDVMMLSGDPGPGRLSSHDWDESAAEQYGAFECVDTESDIHQQGVLDALRAIRLETSHLPQEIITFQPRSEIQPVVFNDYDVGDAVTVASSNVVLEAVNGLTRIYGFTLDIADDGYETVSELVVSPSTSGGGGGE